MGRRLNIAYRWLRVALLIGLSACALSRTPVSGTLQGEVYWQGRVYLDGDVIMAEHSRLIVAPGSEIVFLPPSDGRDSLTAHPNFPGSELIINGELVAEGTPEAPITFRFLDPRAPAGSWGGINLSPGSQASFRFCRFLQADSAVHSQEASVDIEQSLFERNRVGIRFFASQIRIENNLLRDNGTAIRFHFGAPLIRHNQLLDNRQGIFITSFPRDFDIERNAIVGSRDYAVALGEEVPEDVPMPRNYWGTTDIPAIEQSFFDGRRSEYLGSVRIAPILTEAEKGTGLSWNP